jgi:hypothetical protein
VGVTLGAVQRLDADRKASTARRSGECDASAASEAVARLAPGDREQEGTHGRVDLLREDGVRACANLRLGLLGEARDEPGQDVSEAELVGGAVGADGVEAVFEQVVDVRHDLVAGEPDLLKRLAGGVGMSQSSTTVVT